MQAFDGTRFVDLYPAFGNEGPGCSTGEQMLSDISFNDVARFISLRPSRLAESIPDTGMVVVQRKLGDEMCYVFPCGQLADAARRNTWEVRLRVNRGAACSIIVDAEIVTRIPAYARRQIVVGEMEDPLRCARQQHYAGGRLMYNSI